MNRDDSISIVMPTHNRACALRVTLPHLFAVQGIAEIVIVDDGSSDETSALLRETADPRLKVVRNETRRGSPVARNRGVGAATRGWILFCEDDCLLPFDYAAVLRREAEIAGADIVSAPWLNVSEAERHSALEGGRTVPAPSIALDSHPSTFPRESLRTPFLPALALVRRRVFEHVEFFDGFRGNAYREETDFFVSAARLGYVCVLTPKTASFQAGQWSGGQRSNRLRYEYWVWRNNRLFLKRHGGWLRENGYIKSPAASELGLVLSRFKSIVGAHVRTAIGDVP